MWYNPEASREGGLRIYKRQCFSLDIQRLGFIVQRSFSEVVRWTRSTFNTSTMWYVYILKCSNHTYYTGCTNDLEDRLIRHKIPSRSLQMRMNEISLESYNIPPRAFLSIRQICVMRVNEIDFV
jgi:hypothetical protein